MSAHNLTQRPACAPAKKRKVIVLGAGVIGLQTAVSLLEAGYSVAIVARHWPGDESIEYTSPWAGAHWRTHTGPTDHQQQQWDAETFKYWSGLINEGNGEDAGLHFTPALCFWESGPSPPHLWWTSLIPSFNGPHSTSRDTSREATPSCCYARYTTITVHVPRYLNYLLTLARSHGATEHHLPHDVSSLQEALSVPPAGTDEVLVGLVNCTGLGAAKLVPNEEQNMCPVSGQTVTVRGKLDEVRVWIGDQAIAYIIPRIPSTWEGPVAAKSILGGSNGRGDWDPAPSSLLTTEILSRCKSLLLPDDENNLLNASGSFDILSVQIGRRPARLGGPLIRIECCTTLPPDANGLPVFICHHFGHAGAGYQNSVGAARQVVRIVGIWLDENVNGALGRDGLEGRGDR